MIERSLSSDALVRKTVELEERMRMYSVLSERVNALIGGCMYTCTCIMCSICVCVYVCMVC